MILIGTWPHFLHSDVLADSWLLLDAIPITADWVEKRRKS